MALMLAAMAILPVIDVFAKKLGEAGLPILIVVWARALFGGLMTLPFALRAEGAQAFRPAQPLRQLARSALLFSATFLFFQSLKHLPIADALAIFFVNPLVIVILSALALREKVGPRRWAAVAVGFVGTLIIIRPGLVEVNPGTFYALGAGVALGSYFVMTRAMAGVADAMVLNFQTSAIGAALMTLALPFLWLSPSPTQWAMLAALGVIATLGHVLITKAYEHGEASLLAPLAFTEIIMATILGWWFFGDLPDRWTVLGVTILIASAVYISVRERQVKA
ncbi:MAG: DMT family transporter [Tabrizicola sp.]|uniref:DMT family transporter n=1 Tax=Tabrizicola sp. TaxID=2005166 RepID=UPI002ABBF45A|nr:DMT family transporter [Tabrizicola sp.]MDZ4085697.1 DMT family transporter [Tabrizicola sp.]